MTELKLENRKLLCETLVAHGVTSEPGDYNHSIAAAWEYVEELERVIIAVAKERNEALYRGDKLKARMISYQQRYRALKGADGDRD